MAEPLNAPAIEKFLHSLRSVRRYAPTPISDEVVTSILEVGRS